MVIRKKMLELYFVGEFDVSPFVNIPLSVLPQIMSQRFTDINVLASPFAGSEYGTYGTIVGNQMLCAIYRFVRSIPGLCNVSDRTHLVNYELIS
jgi:hypothetical protein